MRRPTKARHTTGGGMRSALAGTISMILGMTLMSAPVLAPSAASADTAPPANRGPETVTADPLPTWQTDRVVWKTAVAGDKGQYIFAGGKFNNIRPPKVPPNGPGSRRQTKLAAFNATTGEPTPFNYEIKGTPRDAGKYPEPGFCDPAGTGKVLCDSVFRVTASPDGKTVYFGGDFTSVGGQERTKLAAVDVATGKLDPNLNPVMKTRVRGLAVTATTVYAGGDFVSVDGQSRTRLAAFDRKTGNLLPWAPVVDNVVHSLAVSPDGKRVIIGGSFNTVNGKPQNRVAAVDSVSGKTNLPWAFNPMPTGETDGWVTDMAVSGNTLYASAEGDGPGTFDGRFAADITTGNRIWLNKCLGGTQAIALADGVLYSASHAHDCSDIGGFPEFDPPETPAPDRRYQRLLAETMAPAGNTGKPSLLHWYPKVNTGTTLDHFLNGPWAVSATAGQVWVGGESTTVNDVSQQGLTRFTYKKTAPDINPPMPFTAAPTAKVAAGKVQVGWPATWDRDNENLTYDVYRRGSSEVKVASNLPKASNFWAMPAMSFVDPSTPPGKYRYRVAAKDVFGNEVKSAESAEVSIGQAVEGKYGAAILADKPGNFWRLDEPARTAPAADSMGANDATYGGGTYPGLPGALTGYGGTGVQTNGWTSGTVAAKTAVAAPKEYSVEFWLKTNRKTGGKIIGMGNKPSGLSTSFDRHVFMDGSGRLNFGVWAGSAKAVVSPKAYNDNAWHHVVATQGPSGMVLYVDGQAVGQNTVNTAASYTGYWRIGGDSLSRWPNKPPSEWFWGGVDETAIYPTVLSAARVNAHYQSGRGADFGAKSPKPNASESASPDPGDQATDGPINEDPANDRGDQESA